MLKCTRTISKLTTLMDFLRTNLTAPTTSRVSSLNIREFWYCEVYDYDKFPDEMMEALLSEPFFTRRMKMLSRPDDKFDLSQIRKLRRGQPIVDFDAADNCRLHVTTMKARFFQDDIPSIPIDNFKDHYVVVFDLTSRQDATEKCHYSELVGEPLRLVLNFTLPLEHTTELIVLGERMSSVAVDQIWCCWKKYQKWKMFFSSK